MYSVRDMKPLLVSVAVVLTSVFACAEIPAADLKIADLRQAAAAQQGMSSAQHGEEAMHHSKPPVPPSNSLTVSYAGKTTTFTPAELAALPQVPVHVHNAHANTDEVYAGPLVADVLAKAGLPVSHETEPVILHSALLASATDGYVVLYSLAEVEPSFSKSQVIVALTKSGQPDVAGGNLQLINTDGAKPARWVHGLSGLKVSTVEADR